MSKIVLVEDDATMRMLLKTLLEMDKHQVTLIGNPVHGILETLLEVKPDILIMDVNLRHSNGIEILKMVRSADLPWRLYILMTSGMDYKNECLDAGADGFLLKPYMPDDLTKQLQKAQTV